jgi:hypothetical protein
MKTGIKNTVRSAIVTAIIALVAQFGGSPAAAQQPVAGRVEQAAFTRPASGDAVQRVQFARQAPSVGDAVEQTISLEMRLTMSMRQSDQIVGKNQNTVRTNQRRVVTATAVDDQRTTAVKVHYAAATKQVVTVDDSGAAMEPAAVPQPVQGKTYICRRESGENEQLVVTDSKGERPPTEELEIVSQQMQMVGRPNPLAQFLAGRTIAVGEKLELPSEVAKQIFNLGDRLGKVTKFTLTLQKVQSDQNVRCAVFRATVEAASSDSTQMRLEIEGPLVVDADTCRARQVSLVGPIGMSESRGTYSTAYQMIGTGRLNMSIASTYHDAGR